MQYVIAESVDCMFVTGNLDRRILYVGFFAGSQTSCVPKDYIELLIVLFPPFLFFFYFY